LSNHKIKFSLVFVVMNYQLQLFLSLFLTLIVTSSCSESNNRTSNGVNQENDDDLVMFIGSPDTNKQTDLSAFFDTSSEVESLDVVESATESAIVYQNGLPKFPEDNISTFPKLNSIPSSQGQDQAALVGSLTKLNEELLQEIRRLKSDRSIERNAISPQGPESLRLKTELIKKTEEINELKTANANLSKRLQKPQVTTGN